MASSTLTVSAAATPPVSGYGLFGIATLSPGMGLFGAAVSRKRKMISRKGILSMSVLGLLLFISLFALGCGGGKSNNKPTPASSQVNLMVTGTSGSLSHSTPVAITIN
jgi:hypothetical protein